MTESSPADLAVAFRSFARRRREAVGDADPVAAADLVADLDVELDAHIVAAAVLLDTSPRADDVAEELEQRPAGDWEESTLAELRRHAFAAAAVLRKIEQRVEAELTDR